MTPIEQLARLSEEKGLKPVERRVGTDGACKIFDFPKPMPRAVRELGRKLDGLDYHYWRAGDEGLKEGFSDFERGEDIHFPAELFSLRRLRFYLRKYKFQWDSWRSDQHVAALERQFARPGAAKVTLDSDMIGPETDEWDRIEAANGVLSDELTKAVANHGLRLHWSYGDSKDWRVIVGMPSEDQLAQFISTDANAGLARELINLIGRTVELKNGFKFYMELDSDERVNADEGWFFRIKGDPQPGREFVFNSKGESLAHA